MAETDDVAHVSLSGRVQEEFYTALPCSDAETTQEPGFIFGIRGTDAGAGDGNNWRKPRGC